MLKKIIYFWFTLKDLKFIQIYHFLVFSLVGYKNLEYNFERVILKKAKRKVFFIKKKNFFFKDGSIIIFNKKIKIKKFDLQSKNSLERYNFFYFDFINSNKFIKNKKKTLKLIKKYIQNSLEKKVTNFWDPYVSSIRLINLVKFLTIMKIDDEELNSFLFHHLITIQKNLEFRLQTNHLLTNLIAINCFYIISKNKNLAEYKYFQDLLYKNIYEQFNKYGEHEELSPMYQTVLIEQLIDLIVIEKAYDQNENKDLLNFVRKLFVALSGTFHTNKKIAFFNDTNYSAINFSDLCLLFNNNFPRKKIKINLNKNYKSRNFVKKILGKFCLIVKISGPNPAHNPGHSHADNFSFEISNKKEKIFINKGISTYKNNNLRYLQRSTRSHNCLEIDNENSSAIWASFRIGKKAKSFIEKVDKRQNLTFSHNGYSNFFKKTIHHRQFKLKFNEIDIIDKIKGRFRIAKIFLHLHPGYFPKIKKKKILIIKKNKIFCTVMTNQDNIKIKKSFFYENFNKYKKINTIVISSKKPLIKTKLQLN